MTTCISAAILNHCQRERPVVGGECLVMYCVVQQMVQPIRRSDLLLIPYSYKGGVEDRSQTFFSQILKDLSVHRISLNSLQDLDYLRNIAQDRAQWRRMQYA